MVTVQFSQGKGILAKAIQIHTWSWTTHVGLVMPDGSILSSDFPRGVHVRPFHPGDYKRVERYEVPHADGKVLEAALSQIGKPYDFMGALGIGLNRRWHDENKWFCSELVAWAFMQANTPLLGGNPARITPRDLLLSPYLRPFNHG